MKYIIALLALGISFPAFAQESTNTQTLNLYPKGREAYSQKFRDRGEQYEVEGRNYIDDLYANGGERTSASSSEPMLPESTLDAVLDNAHTPPASATAAAGTPPDLSHGTTTTP